MARSGLQTGGVSGLGVALVVAGGLLVYTGIRNVSPLDALRAIAAGKPIPQGPQSSVRVMLGKATNQSSDTGTPSSGTTFVSSNGLGPAIAAAARKYLGVPYAINGANPATGLDCSGLVTWVLHHDLGLNLPSNTHTITTQFLVWGGATTISRADIQPGDLVCWTGHIAIATSATKMISAPTLGEKVHETSIPWLPAPPVIRRVKPQGSVTV